MLLTLAIFCWPQMMAMRKRFLMLTCLPHPSYMSTIPSCAMIQAASPFLGWSISSRVTSLKTWSPKGAPCSFIHLIGVFCACLSFYRLTCLVWIPQIPIAIFYVCSTKFHQFQCWHWDPRIYLSSRVRIFWSCCSWRSSHTEYTLIDQ